MPEYKENLWEQIRNNRRIRYNLRRIIITLSFVVIMTVFWSLKLTGIGIAGEAFCGQQEHTHDESCRKKTLICTLEESPPHIHTENCLHRELICDL